MSAQHKVLLKGAKSGSGTLCSCSSSSPQPSSTAPVGLGLTGTGTERSSGLGSSRLGRDSSPASELAYCILTASRARAELRKVLDRLRLWLLVIRVVSESGPTALGKRLRLLRLALAEIDAGATAHTRGTHSHKPILIHTRGCRVANRPVANLAHAAILEFGTLRR